MIKPTILIILSVIVTLMSISCDDYEISDKQADSFLKFYGSGLEDEGMKVIATDEGYLIMGNLENPGSGKDICIIRTDKFGNTLAPVTTYGGEWDDLGYVIKPNSSGYIIAGSTQKEEQGDLDVFILQINSTGDALWSKSYGSSYDDEAFDLLVLENNNIVVTGYTDGSDGQEKDILFFEINSSGDSLYFNHIGSDYDDVAYSFVQKENSYFFVGYSDEHTVSNQQLMKSILVWQWDGIGSLINYSSYFTSLGAGSEAVAIKALNQNEYILSVVQPTQGNGSQIYLVKMDASGHLIWQKSFGERTVNIANDFTIYDESIYVIGTSTNGEVSGDMMILKTGLSGDNPLYFYAGDGTSYTGNGLDFTPDGGYIVTGANITNNNSVITLCKLDAEGLLR